VVRGIGAEKGLRTARRTPEVSLREVFARAVAGLPEGVDPEGRGGVVAEALSHLQEGFDTHYADGPASDDGILVGDNAYARAVETIARLDEPLFVGIASRMIRDGAGEVSSGGTVTIALWTPHLAQLLAVVSGESEGRSEERIRAAVREVEGAGS